MDSDSALVAQLARLDAPGDAQGNRLLGMVVALAGEVFVLKARVERLSRALEATGGIDAARLAETGDSASMQDWLAREEREFTRALLQPWIEPDLAINATVRMLER